MSEPTPALPTSTAEYYRPMPVYLAPRPRQRYWLHGILLLATVFTTLIVGAQMQRNFDRGLSPLWMGDGPVPFFPLGQMLQHPSWLLLGIPFSASLMLILLAHEMGHYLYCVRYGVYATLPYFIPFPSLFGTMGAFIRIRSPIRSRPALFDIGIAGPIAGFVVACAVLAMSLDTMAMWLTPTRRAEGFQVVGACSAGGSFTCTIATSWWWPGPAR